MSNHPRLSFGITILSVFFYNHGVHGDFVDQSGYQRPGKAIDKSEYQLPGRPYDENQMPGSPGDPTEYGLPGRKELPGQNTRLREDIDRRILLNIQDELREGGSYSARFSNVYPVVHDGIVTLNGKVDTQMDKIEAEARARRVDGIRYINNQIIVH